MSVGSNSSTEARRQSRNKIYQFIYHRRQTSRQEIASSLGMSMPTVLQNVRELMADGMVFELGQYASMGGRKAAILAPTKEARYALGLRFSLHSISLVMADMLGNILFYRQARRDFSTGGDYFASLTDTVENFVRDSGVETSRVLGAGIALPAILDRTGKNILTARILGLTAVSCQLFSNHIPYPCLFVNEAKAMAIAEMRTRGDSNRNIVYMQMGDCLGGSVVIGGKLYESDTLRDAEFGHMQLHPGGRPCFCGQRGCSNAYLSTALLSDHAEGSLEQFFARLALGDPALQQVWDVYLDDLALLINNLRMCFDCNVIVGCELGNYLEPYLNSLNRRLAAINAFWMDAKYVEVCRLKTGAASLGAALQWIDRFVEQV